MLVTVWGLGAHICGFASMASGGQFERCYGINSSYSLLNDNDIILFYFMSSLTIGLDPAGMFYSLANFGPARGLSAIFLSICSGYSHQFIINRNTASNEPH